MIKKGGLWSHYKSVKNRLIINSMNFMSWIRKEINVDKGIGDWNGKTCRHYLSTP